MKTRHNTSERKAVGKRAATTAGTKRIVVPFAGFVRFLPPPVSVDVNGSYPVNLKKTHTLSQKRLSLFRKLQYLANKSGFLVALMCPTCGNVVKTSRNYDDLEEGVIAECRECKRKWFNRDSSKEEEA